MEEQANNVAGGSAPEPRRNRGWFKPGGDPRINRDGRPRDEWAACPDRAPRADHLKLLWVPGKALVHRLSHQNAPWLNNLPAGCKVVAIRLDAARDAVALVIRSETFPRIARGAPIPEFKPEFDGLRWGRW